MSLRTYTTWEEDFCSDRCELKGYNDELVAVVETANGDWEVRDGKGLLIGRSTGKEEAQRLAETLL